jgi:hypothetical protein
VVFVIDSTDIERLGTAADELAAMLNEEELHDAALLVFANKQDQPGAKGAGEISEALKLGELRDRNWSIVACSAIDGKGINEGMDWLVVCFPSPRRPVPWTNQLPTCSKQSSQRTNNFSRGFVSGFRFPSFIYLGVRVSPTWVPSSAFEVLYRFFPSTLLRPMESLSYIAS